MARSLHLLPPLLCIALTLLFPSGTFAQEIPGNWRPLQGPGGRITQLAAGGDGRTVFAVTAVEVNRRDDQTQWLERGATAVSEALYRSTDAGATWNPASNDLPPGAITSLYVDKTDGAVWIGLLERSNDLVPRSGPWRSLDQGRTWQRVRLDNAGLIVRTMGRDASARLFAGVASADEPAESYVYVTPDEGANWSRFELPRVGTSSDDILADLLVHPAETGLLFAVTRLGDLLRSDDGGRTWSCDKEELVCDASRGTSSLVIEPDAGRTLWLLGARSGQRSVLRSTDLGESWVEVAAQGLPDAQEGVLAAAALGNGVLLVNTHGGTYRSVDRGATWQLLEGVLSSGPANEFVLLGGSSRQATVLAGAGHGLFASSDSGALWRASGDGLPYNSGIAAISSHPRQTGVIVALPRGEGRAPGILVSRDAGQTWLPGDGGVAGEAATAVAMDPKNAQKWVIAGWKYVSTTNDGGLTWKSSSLPPGQRTAIAFASSSQHIYVDGMPALHSSDGGETWATLNVQSTPDIRPSTVRGIAVHPEDAQHVWAGTDSGVLESLDGGASWHPFGLDGLQVRWLAAVPTPGAAAQMFLFAGVAGNGIMRWDSSTGAASAGRQVDWLHASSGLPDSSDVLAFIADPRSPGQLWATRDGGGIYRSKDNGASWLNAGAGVGDNLGLALAVNYADGGALYMATANAGVWSLGAEAPLPAATQTPARAPTGGSAQGASAAGEGATQPGIDARIEVVWPHDFAPLDQAKLANVGLRLFMHESLQPPACGWRPTVRLWRAVNTEPARLAGPADQRTVDGQTFPYWEVNDVDVSEARDSATKIYFMVQVEGLNTATSVWAHAADARTYFPEQLVPSGVASGAVEAVDARIQIVWPHDSQGSQQDVSKATLANVVVTLFKHGTRLSVPGDFRPEAMTLYGAWNAEVARPLAAAALVTTRQSGAIAYPSWEFNDVPVARAIDPGNRLYLWAEVSGVESFPTIWAHGADSRTLFPTKDEPIQGCLP